MPLKKANINQLPTIPMKALAKATPPVLPLRWACSIKSSSFKPGKQKELGNDKPRLVYKRNPLVNEYFKTSFHPRQKDNRELLDKWQENVSLLHQGSHNN